MGSVSGGIVVGRSQLLVTVYGDTLIFPLVHIACKDVVKGEP